MNCDASKGCKGGVGLFLSARSNWKVIAHESKSALSQRKREDCERRKAQKGSGKFCERGSGPMRRRRPSTDVTHHGCCNKKDECAHELRFTKLAIVGMLPFHCTGKVCDHVQEKEGRRIDARQWGFSCHTGHTMDSQRCRQLDCCSARLPCS